MKSKALIILFILTGFLLFNFTISNNYVINNNSFQPFQLCALKMAITKWTPIKKVPNNTGYFNGGEKIIGLPYSSAKQFQKFIGLDVSIYTFLTAVQNPNSLLYTQNIGKGNVCYLGGEYYGENCATFYGTVCSSFIAFCFDEPHNYTSYNYHDGMVPNYKIKKSQNIDSIKPGDLWWNKGHVAIIYNIGYDECGKTQWIEIAESGGTKVTIMHYTREKFIKRYNGNGKPELKAVLYSHPINSLCKPTSFDSLNFINSDTLRYNDVITTWFGDKPCVADWDKLVLNFRAEGFDSLIVCKNDAEIDSFEIFDNTENFDYHHKGPGIYKAFLKLGNHKSPCTSFEIVDTYTEYIDEEVIFAPNSKPVVVYWVDKVGNQLSIPIIVNDEQRESGRLYLKSFPNKEAILRVIYQGKYGRAINKPAYLNSIHNNC